MSDRVTRHLDTGVDKPIDEVFAWIIDDERGGEAIPAAQLGDLVFPLIGADRARAESYRGFAIAVRNQTGKRCRLVRFTKAEVVDELLDG